MSCIETVCVFTHYIYGILFPFLEFIKPVHQVSYRILVPRAHDPSGLWQGSRALAGPDCLRMRRVFVSNSQPTRFARFDGKSVNRGLPVLDQTRSLDPCHRPERSWALGTRMLVPLTETSLTHSFMFSPGFTVNQKSSSKALRVSKVWQKLQLALQEVLKKLLSITRHFDQTFEANAIYTHNNAWPR